MIRIWFDFTLSECIMLMYNCLFLVPYLAAFAAAEYCPTPGTTAGSPPVPPSPPGSPPPGPPETPF